MKGITQTDRGNLYYRRKCEVDGKEVKAELTAQRNMFPSAQIKMRYVLRIIIKYLLAANTSLHSEINQNSGHVEIWSNSLRIN